MGWFSPEVTFFGFMFMLSSSRSWEIASCRNKEAVMFGLNSLVTLLREPAAGKV